MRVGKPSKKIAQLTIDGDLIKIWPSTSEAGRNGFGRVGIYHCLAGRAKTCGGFKWIEEADLLRAPTEERGKYKKRRIAQLSLTNDLIKIWDCLTEAGNCNRTRDGISNCLSGWFKSYNGFKWVYESELPTMK